MDCPRCGATGVDDSRVPPLRGGPREGSRAAGPRPGSSPRSSRRPRVAGLAAPRLSVILRARRHRGRGRARRPAPRIPEALPSPQPAGASVAGSPAARPPPSWRPPVATPASAVPVERSERRSAARPMPTGKPPRPWWSSSSSGRRSPRRPPGGRGLFARYPAEPSRDLLEGVAGSRPPRRPAKQRATGAAASAPRPGAAGRRARPRSLAAPCWRCASKRETGPRAERRRPRPPGPRSRRTPRRPAVFAYALVRQDRSREAIEVLARVRRRAPRPGDPRAPRAESGRDPGTEACLDEARLAHFHVRYDGESARGRRAGDPPGPRPALRDARADLRPPAGRAHPGRPPVQREVLRRDRRAGLVGRPLRLLRRPRAHPDRRADRRPRPPTSTTRSSTS